MLLFYIVYVAMLPEVNSPRSEMRERERERERERGRESQNWLGTWRWR